MEMRMEGQEGGWRVRGKAAVEGERGYGKGKESSTSIFIQGPPSPYFMPLL